MKPVDVPFAQWADINRTERFVAVRPLSGYLMVQLDDDGYVIYLPPDVNDDALGRALLEALSRSRFIWPPDEPNFFKWQRYKRCHQDWQKEFMRRYGYKTKRDAYRNMNWCRTKRSEGGIQNRPHRRDRPGYWTDLAEDRNVVIPATEDPVTVGAALRLALDRCE